MFILELTYIAPIERIDAALPEHTAWLDAHYAEGTFIASGRKVPRDGGVIIATGDDRVKIEEIVKSDPFSVAGVAEYTVTQFVATKTAPPLEPYRQELPS
ncbi:YciI family protein [Kitasatospora sp. NPDC056138]|uniref:YciI family protein n=1 Tax=Kitasatospora sp. NPDC056138 TaxID=3345724 RepID=UPI0035DB43F9